MFSFLDVFEGKPDHPMSDVRQAKKLLAELPSDNYYAALAEITNWVNSVRGTPGFRPETRAEILMLLDETGQQSYEALLHLYVGEPHLQDFKGKQLFQELCDFKEAVADAYTLCIDEYRMADKPHADFKKIIPVICIRQLRALCEQMQLGMMSYAEMRAEVWHTLYRTYEFSLREHFSDVMCAVYPQQVGQISVQREFIRTNMLYLAFPSTLTPDQVVACGHITGLLVGSFDFKTEADEQSSYFIDLAKPAAPCRIKEMPKAAATLRFLGASKVLAKMADIVAHHQSDLARHERRVESEFMPGGKLTVLKHLQLYWGKTPPERMQERHSAQGTLEVIHGIVVISQAVTRIDHGSLVNLPQRDSMGNAPLMGLAGDEVAAAPEVWAVSDTSEKGLGGVIPKATSSWVKVGDLCGLRMADSGVWWVAMVRRLRAGNAGEMLVGIEILAKKPLAIFLRDRTGKADKMYQWDVSTDSIKHRDFPVILLPDSNNSYANATMLMQTGGYTPDAVYELLMGTKNRFVKLTGLLEEGGDYERVSFTLLNIQ